MIVDKKSMQAALANDFNQINLNNINSNITTTSTATTVNTVVTTTTTTTVQHKQNNKQTKSLSTAQSPLSKRHLTTTSSALQTHALIANQQHLRQQQTPQNLQQKSQIHPMQESMNLEVLENKPILRKSPSTPTFNGEEAVCCPSKSDVQIISNNKQQRQQHHLQQQQQLHSSHCQEHINNIKNAYNNKLSAIINNTCNTLSSNTIPAETTSPVTTTSLTSPASSLSQRLGCGHYKRKAMFVTPCCKKFYKCRFCHDENESHHFDRKTLTELICSECNTRQKVQESCEHCGIRFGKYTCLICNLFDDEDKRQYHCRKCGICRIGGKENFFHCEVCNMCLPIQLKIDGHRCVENISRSHCPVCLGDIHTSRIPCHIPDCGHLLHKMCFDQLLNSGHYACPTCQTSLIDMSALWEYLDVQAKLMPVPKKYENEKIHIFCNDCHTTSKTSFHFIGLKCSNCGAYNTTQDVKRRMSIAADDSLSA